MCPVQARLRRSSRFQQGYLRREPLDTRTAQRSRACCSAVPRRHLRRRSRTPLSVATVASSAALAIRMDPATSVRSCARMITGSPTESKQTGVVRVRFVVAHVILLARYVNCLLSTSQLPRSALVMVPSRIHVR